MSHRMQAFRSEKALARAARDVVRGLRENLGRTLGVRYEVPAPGGIPDLIFFLRGQQALDYVVTVEFKLRDWRRALFQAFKNRNFGNEAYVVLDPARLQPALNNLLEFQRANVGLATIERGGTVTVWHYPSPDLPFSQRFAEKVATNLLRTQQPKSSDLRFTRSVKGGMPLAELRRSWGAERAVCRDYRDQV